MPAAHKVPIKEFAAMTIQQQPPTRKCWFCAKNSSLCKCGLQLVDDLGALYHAADKNLGAGTFGWVTRRLGKEDGIPYAIKTYHATCPDGYLPHEVGLPGTFLREVYCGALMKSSSHIMSATRAVVELPAAKEKKYHCGTPYIVMPVASQSLENYIEMHIERPIPILQIAIWMRQIMVGVKALHSKRVAHLDIKPGNVLLVYNKATKETEVQLCDMGECSLDIRDASDAAGCPRVSRRYGSSRAAPIYTAPETMTHRAVNSSHRPSVGGGGDHLDFTKHPLDAGYLPYKTDIWACGFLLLHLLAGDTQLMASETPQEGIQLMTQLLHPYWLTVSPLDGLSKRRSMIGSAIPGQYRKAKHVAGWQTVLVALAIEHNTVAKNMRKKIISFDDSMGHTYDNMFGATQQRLLVVERCRTGLLRSMMPSSVRSRANLGGMNYNLAFDREAMHTMDCQRVLPYSMIFNSERLHFTKRLQARPQFTQPCSGSAWAPHFVAIDGSVHGRMIYNLREFIVSRYSNADRPQVYIALDMALWMMRMDMRLRPSATHTLMHPFVARMLPAAASLPPSPGRGKSQPIQDEDWFGGQLVLGLLKTWLTGEPTLRDLNSTCIHSTIQLFVRVRTVWRQSYHHHHHTGAAPCTHPCNFCHDQRRWTQIMLCCLNISAKIFERVSAYTSFLGIKRAAAAWQSKHFTNLPDGSIGIAAAITKDATLMDLMHRNFKDTPTIASWPDQHSGASKARGIEGVLGLYVVLERCILASLEVLIGTPLDLVVLAQFRSHQNNSNHQGHSGKAKIKAAAVSLYPLLCASPHRSEYFAGTIPILGLDKLIDGTPTKIRKWVASLTGCLGGWGPTDQRPWHSLASGALGLRKLVLGNSTPSSSPPRPPEVPM